MNTPAHVVVNLLAVGSESRPADNVPILAGALLPDLPMVAFYFYEKVLLRMPEAYIWSQAYYAPGWQAFFDSFNSLPLIALGVLLAYRFAAPRLGVFFLSMAVHVLFDLPLHNDDSHRHFFPFSDWRFHSPVSYWDPRHYGQIMAPLEAAVVVLGCVFLLRRHTSMGARGLIGAVAVVYVLYWGYVFWIWV